MKCSTHVTLADLESMFDEAAALVGRCKDALLPASFNALLHRILVACCHEGTRDSGQAYGNLFAQVDYLCREHGVPISRRLGIQQVRRHSNRSTGLTPEQGRHDLAALRWFAHELLGVAGGTSNNMEAPAETLAHSIPEPHAQIPRSPVLQRCIVQSFTDHTITVMPADAVDQGVERLVEVDYSAPHLHYLRQLLREGMQLNVGDGLIVVEPDYLIDISRIAACFEEHGHHPLNYLLNMMKPSAMTQPILLGNMAGALLDDAIHAPSECTFGDTLRRHFRDSALEYAACEGFSPDAFKTDAHEQERNIREAVQLLDSQLYGAGERGGKTDAAPDDGGVGALRGDAPQPSHPSLSEQAILEPSFICEQLGISGRVDLMTKDFRLLVEQKSGKNWNIQTGRPGRYGSVQLEPHYVQLLLYYGVLQRNFHLDFDHVRLRLLYSRFPAERGLVVVNYLQPLFREAIRVRNEIVAMCLGIARDGFEPLIPHITPAELNVEQSSSPLFIRFKLPEIQSVADTLQSLSPLERAYFSRMMTFVFREQRVGKLGRQDNLSVGTADLWNMPLQQKTDSGNIMAALHGQPVDDSTIVLTGNDDIERSNFRRGDMVYLYAYVPPAEPDVRNSILYRGHLTELSHGHITVSLSNPQHLDPRATYAIEHAASDSTATSAVRGLYALMTAPADRRQLLLSEREPRCDAEVTLSQSYHPDYDDVLLQAFRAKDFFLLVGPPGTGKTSMALQYLVREELTHADASLLLMAYTNRAVDEICGMLEAAQIDYLRLGSAHSCDPAYRAHLPETLADNCPRLSDVEARLLDSRVVVGTTSMLQARAYIFGVKRFSLAVIDEAGQILEPSIVGLLSKPQIARFILIGDHKQLPAVVQQNERDARVEESELHKIGLTDCRRSLFERLIARERQLGRTSFVGTLRKQGRMHPDIAAWPSHMFYANEQLRPVPLPHQQEASTQPRMRFIPAELNHVPGLTDQVSLDEARIVARELLYIYNEWGTAFSAQRTAGVIVPYRNQIAVVRGEIEKLGISTLRDISIDTVERYQGSQRDVIIYSLTVQRPYQLDFLTAQTFEEDGRLIDRKLNVALTRARRQLILTGNEPLLARDPLLRALIDYIKASTP